MKKIENWIDYNKLIKYENENITDIRDTYIYKLQEKLSDTRKELRIIQNKDIKLEIVKLNRLLEKMVLNDNNRF